MLIAWCIASTLLLLYVISSYISIDCKYSDLKQKVLNQELKVWFSNVAAEPVYTKDFRLFTQTRVKISSEKDLVRIFIGTQEYKMTKDEFHRMTIEIESDQIKV